MNKQKSLTSRVYLFQLGKLLKTPHIYRLTHSRTETLLNLRFLDKSFTKYLETCMNHVLRHDYTMLKNIVSRVYLFPLGKLLKTPQNSTYSQTHRHTHPRMETLLNLRFLDKSYPFSIPFEDVFV